MMHATSHATEKEQKSTSGVKINGAKAVKGTPCMVFVMTCTSYCCRIRVSNIFYDTHSKI